MKLTKELLVKLEDAVAEHKDKLKMQEDQLDTIKTKNTNVANYLADTQKLLKKSKKMAEEVIRASRDHTLFKLNGLSKAISDDLVKLAEEREKVSNALLEAQNKTQTARDAAEAIPEILEKLDEAREELVKEESSKRQKREADFDKEAIRKKAQELSEEAAKLNGTFGSTRLESESALAAANVYENLKDSLEKAREASTEAIAVAEKEQGGLEELNKNVATSLADSKKLNEDSSKLRSEVDELSKQAMTAEKEADLMADQVEAMKKINNQLKESLKNPLTAESNKIQEKIDQAQSISADIEKARESNKDRLQQTKDDADRALNAHAEAAQSVKTARVNIKKLAALRPKLIAAFDAMKNAASNRTAKLEGLTDKMGQIREMIAVARDAANRIRLGAHFERGSSLDLNMPHRVSRSAAHTDISFYFRTQSDHGIPLFFGNEEGSAG